MLNLLAQLEHSLRHKQWIAAGQGCAAFLGHEAEVQVQGLGRLDVELIWADENAAERAKSKNPVEAMLWSDMSYRLTLARLWVLGSYELVRVLNEVTQSKLLANEIRSNLSRVKSSFDRIRMPLAKLEAARKHRGTDFSVAAPIVHHSEGIGWLLAPSTFVTRRALSDSFIELGSALNGPHAQQGVQADPSAFGGRSA